jgi:membrane protein implicated in regulation of membrane protease activity
MSRLSLVAEATAAGLFFPLAIVAGYLLGKAVAAALSLPPAIAIGGAALGVVAGFVNLGRLVKRMESRGGRS